MKKLVYMISDNDQETKSAVQNNASSNLDEIQKTVIQDKVQTITTILDNGLTFPIIVQKNIPLRWTITAENDDINDWNIEILIKEFGVDQKLKAGKNIIEFTPTQANTFEYSCWLDQITSTITVVNDINNFTVQDINNYIDYLGYESAAILCHNGSGI